MPRSKKPDNKQTKSAKVAVAPNTGSVQSELKSVRPAFEGFIASSAQHTEGLDGGADGTAPPEPASATPPKPPVPAGASTPIPKPDTTFSLEKFRSKRDAALANVETYQTGLPHHRIVDAKDFVRINPDPAYWSPELCFVAIPVKGQKHDILHLIDEELAVQFLPAGRIQRFRLALATKPYDVLFLCEIPTQNLDNSWNATNVQACEDAKTLWTMVSSRKLEGVEGYKIDHAKDPDAFTEPKWPPQSLGLLIERTFKGRMIETEDHPALLRLIGAKQNLK